MGSDDGITQGKLERERLLEEIRRRAEEAEIKRIEEEEAGRKSNDEPSSPPQDNPPQIDPTASLRERLLIALDRGKTDKASELLADLRALTPDDPRLKEYQSRFASLNASRPAAPPDRKRIAELIAQANSFYQQEKYQKGLEILTEVFALDPENEDAKILHPQIEKARLLADQIKAEDAKRREEEAAVFPPQASPLPPAPASVHEKDVWGTPYPAKGSDTGFDITSSEPARPVPPQPSVISRMVKRASTIKIPVKPLITVGGVLVLIVAAYFIVEHIRSAVVPPSYSLMVLPAVAVGSDSTLPLLAAGLTDDLIHDFMSVNELRVIGAVTSFASRASKLSDITIARNMGADHFLQMSLTRIEDGVVGDVTLQDTVSSKPVWTRHFQATLGNLPAAKFETVRAVLSALEIQPGEGEEGFFQKAPAVNARAYEAYLSGRAALVQPDPARLNAAVLWLQEAVDADSNFADAQSGLGWAHVLMAEGERNPSPSHLAQASVCIQRAISLGSRSSETFRVWGITEELWSRYDKAVERFEHAVTLSPSDAESQRRLALASAARGDMETALKAAHRIVADDPMNIASYSTLGLIQQFGEDYKGALASYEHAMTLAKDPEEYASRFYADVLVNLHQPDRALSILTERLSRDGATYSDYYKVGRVDQTAGKPKQDWQDAFLRAKVLVGDTLAVRPRDAAALSSLALIETRLGAFKEAIAASNKALQLDSSDAAVLYNTARMYALQRDKSQALAFLSRAAARRFSLPALLDMDFFNLRSEPEFLTTITR